MYIALSFWHERLVEKKPWVFLAGTETIGTSHFTDSDVYVLQFSWYGGKFFRCLFFS